MDKQRMDACVCECEMKTDCCYTLQNSCNESKKENVKYLFLYRTKKVIK
uniref:Uncharacterized protein n=1 Tax=Anopheles quadriannulatus TaxID=34691 RepID=A0A182XRX3_ANOQN